MITIPCSVDEIQTAIDEYRNIYDVVSDKENDIIRAFQTQQIEMSDWNPFKYVNVFWFIKFYMILDGSTDLDLFFEERSDIPLSFHMKDTGQQLADNLERYMYLTPETTSKFYLNGEELEFVSFFCTSWAERNAEV